MTRIFTLILIAVNSCAFAQDSLKNFNYSRNQTTAVGMEVLGSWGLANIGLGVAGLAASKGGRNQYFYQMTAVWGGVNLAIALPGLINAEKNKSGNLSPAESLKAQQKIERTFLYNGGLDIVYIGAGLYLQNRGNDNNDTQLRGYGSSVIMQGAFLLLFDATLYSSQRHLGNKLRRFLEKNPVTFSGRSIGISLNI